MLLFISSLPLWQPFLKVHNMTKPGEIDIPQAQKNFAVGVAAIFIGFLAAAAIFAGAQAIFGG